MSGECAALDADAPIVRALLGVVDCNVQSLVHDGYAALFSGSGGFAGLLTLLLTAWVALIGYQLMLGRAQLRVTDFALNAVKLGVVLALATQWDTYQAVVYRFLFEGPQQLAAMMLQSVQPSHSDFRGDVFDGLQRAFDDLNGFAAGYANHSAPGVSPILGGSGFGAAIMTFAASTLLLSTLGVLLAAKVVLGLLLALGPLFIVLFLFESTRGVFEGWARASLAFAFAPLASIFLLGVMLMILGPTLLQIEALQARGIYSLTPAYDVVILVLVLAGMTLGALIAGGMIAAGFRLPKVRLAAPQGDGVRGSARQEDSRGAAAQPRAARTAAAVSAMDRRDSTVFAQRAVPDIDRRASLAGSRPDRGPREAPSLTRLGQTPRRAAQPRSTRPSGARDRLRGVR